MSRVTVVCDVKGLVAMSNPFLVPSTLPYQLPPFEQIGEEHYAEAFAAGFSEHDAEVEAIAAATETATFQNTVVALERSGASLRRVALVFFSNSASHSTPGIQALEQEMAPKFSEHEDNIFLDRRLFDRLNAITDVPPEDAEAQRLLGDYRNRFIRAGAQLADNEQQRLRQLNSRISALQTTFSQRLLQDSNEAALLVDTETELDGFSADAIASASDAAREAGHEGKFLLPLILPTSQPALAQLKNRETRRRLHLAAVNRGTGAKNTNTLGIAAELAALRAERAALLGFGNHAEYATADQTAPSLEAIHEMLGRLAPAAVRNARAEAAELKEHAGHPLEAWDWTYYADQVRKAKFEVDLGALRPYFELERVIQDGIFFAANKLYGLTFTERPDLSGYHPEVRVWEVFNEDGSGLGLFLGDYYTRDTKNGGAWMNSFVEQSRLLDTPAVVINNLNIPKPPVGEPTLLTYDQVVTAFHEFGHALHGLFSDVTYPQFSGTSVPRDFVEYPSQVNEMWILWPEIVENYARHYKTGEPLARETIDRLEAASTWGEGFATTEYLGATLLDLAWHELAPGKSVADPLAFEQQALQEAGVDFALVPPRYRTGYFKHIFAGGYSAAYYAYIWSEVLDADTVEWFKASGGLTRANGDRFRELLLSRGNSRDPLESFRSFRGRNAEAGPLIARRGLA